MSILVIYIIYCMYYDCFFMMSSSCVYIRSSSWELQVNNIYFELDKHNITYKAALELNKVIIIMERCENIDIIASSHTDSRASHTYNQALSQRRAQATVDYLTNVGNISSSRLKAIGFGEKRLINRCADDVKCSEAEHQQNRRTQFVISNY